MSRPWIAPEMLRRIMEPTRALANDLGTYFNADRIEPIAPITEPVRGFNPRAWPPCKHCGGNVSCQAYEPDTSKPLWGASE